MFDEPEPSSRRSLTGTAKDSYLESVARARFIWGAIAVLLLPVLIDPPLLEFVSSRYGVTMLIGAGILAARYGLVVMWLAWGGSRVIWRLIATILSMILASTIFGMVFGSFESISIFVLLSLIAGAIVAIPRWFGVRWVVLDEIRPGDNRSAGTHQFSLIDLFVWTTMVAVVVALTRWLGVPWEVRANPGVMVLFMISFAVVPSIAILTAMWATLSMHARPSIRVPVAVVAMATLSVAASMLYCSWFLPGRFNWGTSVFLALFVGFVTFWVSMFLLLLRVFGHRLIRVPRPNSAAADQSIEFTSSNTGEP